MKGIKDYMPVLFQINDIGARGYAKSGDERVLIVMPLALRRGIRGFQCV